MPRASGGRKLSSRRAGRPRRGRRAPCRPRRLSPSTPRRRSRAPHDRAGLLSSHQLPPRNHLNLAADVDASLVAFLLRPQVQERGTTDLIPLLDPHVYVSGAEVAMLYQVGGQAACGAAGRRVLGDAEVVREHAGGEVARTVVVRLRAEDVQVLPRSGQFEVAVPVDLAPPEGVKVSQRYYNGRESGGYFLRGEAVIQVRRFEVEGQGGRVAV